MAIVGAHMLLYSPEADALRAMLRDVRSQGIEFRSEPRDAGFGIITTMLLPGGVELLLYEPKHASPLQP